MKQFLTKLLRYFLLIFLLTVSSFLVLVPQFYNDFTASIEDKLERLESIDGPKLILVGNSNLVYGIDSAMLEEALDMPVVNLGLHGGLGNMFHYNMAKRNIAQGDIVVLLNTHFDEGVILEPDVAWITIENGKDYWKLIPRESWMDMVLAFPGYVVSTMSSFGLQRAKSVTSGPYARRAINEYGDSTWNREDSQVTFTEGMVAVPEITEKGIAQINEFNAFCQQQGAVCLLGGYAIPSGPVTPPAEAYDRMQQELERLLDCEVISDYSDYLLDYQYFYDTQYHLTNEGTKLRTQQLKDDLLSWREKP